MIGFRVGAPSGRGQGERLASLLTRTRTGEVVLALALGGAIVAALRFGLTVGVGPERLLGFLLAGAAMVLLVRRPLIAIRVALLVVPLSVVVLAQLLTWGVPPDIVRSGAILKDAVVVAVVVAGLRARAARGQPLAPLDRAGLAYLALAGLWWVLTPFIAVEPLSGDARLVALRQMVLFPAMFLGVRWLAPSAAERHALVRWLVRAAVVIALGGVYQRLDRDGFAQRILIDIDIIRYYREVAGLSGRALGQQIGWFSVEPLRVVSFLIAPFAFADVMVTAFAATVATVVQSRSRRLTLAAIGLFGVAVVWSGTRVNMIALAVVVLAATFDRRGVSERTRVQVVVVGLVALLAFTPTVLSSRLLSESNEDSNEGHRNELTTAAEKIVTRPLGYGLGSDGAVQRRYEVTSATADTVSGNTVLAIGVQGGVLTMAAFVVFLLSVVRELERRRRADPHDALVRMSFLVLVGGLVAVSTHQGWLDLTSGTFVWIAIGLGLPEVAPALVPGEDRSRVEA